MPAEPPVKRTVAFFDGQNLFHAVKSAFGYTYPNFDVKALAQSICAANGWQLDQVRFYTGVPDSTDNAMWNGFWTAKLLAMSRQGVWTFSRPLRRGPGVILRRQSGVAIPVVVLGEFRYGIAGSRLFASNTAPQEFQGSISVTPHPS